MTMSMNTTVQQKEKNLENLRLWVDVILIYDYCSFIKAMFSLLVLSLLFIKKGFKAGYLNNFIVSIKAKNQGEKPKLILHEIFFFTMLVY